MPSESKPYLQVSRCSSLNAKSKTYCALVLLLSLVSTADCTCAAEDGFTPLFNGQDLRGWIGAKEGFAVSDGAIVCVKGTSGNLFTSRTYSDFVLRFEFRLTPGANNGLGVRAPLSRDAAFQGLEIQILDNSSDRYANLKPYQYHGSIYGIAAARRGFLKPPGQWNEQEVTCNGRRVTVVLNGTRILNVDLDQVAVNGQTLDGQGHPGLQRQTGHIGFLAHGDRVEFRNIRLKDLSIGKGVHGVQSVETIGSTLFISPCCNARRAHCVTACCRCSRSTCKPVRKVPCQ